MKQDMALKSFLMALAAVVALVSVPTVFADDNAAVPANAGSAASENLATIKMATTTSTDNSGLLDYLLPIVEKEVGVRVHVIAVGSGRALKLAENGDVDILFSHAPDDEKLFVANGCSRERREVMYNDFVVVGPASDPAKTATVATAVDAFKNISQSGSAFVSRGDDSGTHKKEKAIWAAAEIEPQGKKWYLEAGQGMEAVLIMADQKDAYTLTDRGTFDAIGDNVKLKILVQGDPLFFNQYAIMVVNPDKHPHVKYDPAQKFADWLVSPRGQQAIADFRAHDKQLFFPNAK